MLRLKIILFLNEDSGTTSIEYAMIAALISIFCVGIMYSLGDSLLKQHTYVLNNIKD